MTANKPNVQRYVNMGCPEEICRVDTMYESDDGDYVLYEDYEALQADHEQLRKDAAAALIALPDSLPMEPYQTVDRGSPHYKAGWNACRRAILAALEKMMEDPIHDQ